jgi:hypothetical protein
MTIINAFNDYYHRMQPRITMSWISKSLLCQKRIQLRVIWQIVPGIRIAGMDPAVEKKAIKKIICP